jgi:hypothetical protein
MSKQQTTYLYYKGEKSNPFEEVNASQGAWCERYNGIASLLWYFEYHWANGWGKYKQLIPQNNCYYFELYKEPQKAFSNIHEALLTFAMHTYSDLLHNGSERWITYIYEHAMEERFYKPLYYVVPASEIPQYLHWYKGENTDPYLHTQQANAECSFWWGFEMHWYASTEKPTKEGWENYLKSYLMRNSANTNPESDAYKQELEELIKRYKGISE